LPLANAPDRRGWCELCDDAEGTVGDNRGEAIAFVDDGTNPKFCGFGNSPVDWRSERAALDVVLEPFDGRRGG
jgi:hypothetical protein